MKTTNLSLPRGGWRDISPPIAAMIGTFALILIAAISGRIQRLPPTDQAVPTPPLPIIVIARAPTALPAQQAAYQPQAPAVRYVVGFDSPDGRALGAIVAPQSGAIVARWGDDWLETMHDGAPIWIRARELGMNLANLAPEVPQAQPQIIYQVVNQPPTQPEEAAPTPAGETQDVASLPPAPQQLAIQDREQWAIQAAQQPTPALSAPPAAVPSDIDRANIQEAWRQEHCVGDRCIP